MNSTILENNEKIGLNAFSFSDYFHFDNGTCLNSALYFNASAGVVLVEQKSELLPFYCKYGHENPNTFDFVKIEEENRNKSCPMNFTFVPDLPDPCVKSLGGTVEEAEAACNFYGGEIIDLSTPHSVLKRLIFSLNIL